MNVISSNLWRTVRQIVAGVLFSVPGGIFLYFGSVMIWAGVINTLTLPLALIHVGTRFADWIDFSVGVTVLLIAGVVAAEIWLCRRLLQRHVSAFAYTQAVLSLAVSAPFFYWTLVHQKPMLPFYGQ